MHLSKKEKLELTKLLKTVDPKKLSIDHKDERIVKWFRFGAYSGLQIAAEIIKSLPEKPSAKTKVPIAE